MIDDPRQLDLFSQTDVKNIAISGLSGMVGSHLKTEFQRRGWFIKAIPKKILNDPESLKELFKDVDVVINLAGENIGHGRWTEKKKKRILDSRIDTTRKIVEALNDPMLPPKVLVSTSAVGYYGAMAKQVEGEEGNSGTDFLANVCKAWEEEALKYKKGRVIITRFGAVLSFKGGLFSQFLTMAKFCVLGKMGDGTKQMSWISIDDLTDSIAFCIKHKNIEGPVNLTSPNPISNGDFVTALAQSVNRPAFMHMPEGMIKLFFGEKGKELFLSDQSIYPKKLIDSGYIFKHERLNDFVRTSK